MGGKTGRRAKGKCPSWVVGATTAVQDGEDSVVLSITASTESATKEIRERAKYMQLGTKGGDATGQCPVIRDVRIEASEIPGGARVVLRSTPNFDLAGLRNEVRARVSRTVQ